MQHAFAIVRRDLLRILRIPASWIIVLGLIFIPPLYAWFNIVGFWDPYGNTRNLRVAVANDDRGATATALGAVNLGDQIVAQLKTNHQLGWHAADRATAMDEVRSGRSYAAIVIPPDFSSRVAGVVNGDTKRPMLDYYVNEKLNGIGAKITGTGASTLNRQVNDSFVSTVSHVVSEAVNREAGDIGANADSVTSQTIADLKTVSGDIAQVRSSITTLNDQLSRSPQRTADARDTLSQVSTMGVGAARDLTSLSSLIGETQTGLNRFTASSSQTLDNGSALLSQTGARTNLALSGLGAQLTQANGDLRTTLDTARQVNDANKEILATLRALNGDDLPGLNAIIDTLDRQNGRIGDTIGDLQRLNTDTGTTIDSTGKAADAINSTTQRTLSTSDAARHNGLVTTLPRLNNGLSTLSSSSAALGGTLSGQQASIRQAQVVLDQLDHATTTTVQALQDTDKGLNQLQTRIDALTVDLGSLSSANALKALFGTNRTLDVPAITAFMLAPTVLDTTVLYPVRSYGSGMAPLFTNLSLWVGAFMLVVMMKLEVDRDNLPETTMGQRYWGRWMLLAMMAAVQGLVTTVGELIIGVQTANAPLFVLTAVIASLVYISITYTLSTTFLHVGKGLCMALIILQIPGASGLYPIEMMPGFFKAMHPFFPFTYAIAALRETIGGFYGNHWGDNIALLLVFAAAFFVLGLSARPRLITVNRLFARELAESDIISSETVLDEGHEYQVSQALAALADKSEYRRLIEGKAVSFARLYPRLKRGAIIAGIVVPAALALTFSLTNGTKLVALAAWVVWFLLITAFLLAIELIGDSLNRQLRLGTLSDGAIRDIVYARHRRHPLASAGQHATERQDAAVAGAHTTAPLAAAAAMPDAAGTKERKDRS
ncbi:YhgE/Pip domain-containing protein [Bifidobacterium mongoliense]|uniref:Phage infection protein-like protein n=1 Tax=Bifidobacterium mongoliense TaxID=518643 RepID=A0A423UDI4_9BIFI|nr:YhgE/Pip domain-containing protein [Bifidobacterium mongoliense]ROT86774.1 phage infection protein-like protein [Bifidobacterium mongoliense]